VVGVGSNKPGGRRPAGQQPRLDPAAAAEQLGVGAVGVRPAPLLVMVDLAWHIP
jgi:hypothetical protein